MCALDRLRGMFPHPQDAAGSAPLPPLRVFLVLIGTKSCSTSALFPSDLYQSLFQREAPDVVVWSKKYKQHAQRIQRASDNHPCQTVFIVDCTGRSSKELLAIADVVHQVPRSTLLGLCVDDMALDTQSFTSFDHLVHFHSRSAMAVLGASLYMAAVDFTSPAASFTPAVPNAVVAAALLFDSSASAPVWLALAAHAGTYMFQASFVAGHDPSSYKHALLHLLPRYYDKAQEKALGV